MLCGGVLLCMFVSVYMCVYSSRVRASLFLCVFAYDMCGCVCMYITASQVRMRTGKVCILMYFAFHLYYCSIRHNIHLLHPIIFTYCIS